MKNEARPGSTRRPWSVTLPFLVLGYPLTYLIFQADQYCEPLCFTPTSVGVGTLAVSLLVLLLLSGGITFGLRTWRWGDDGDVVRRLVAPPPVVGVVLFGLFGAFVVFLTLDFLSLYETIWKPVVLPISFLLFLPVWVLYMATFPLAILISVTGFEPSSSFTLLTRGVVLLVGFPFAAVLQTYVASTVVSKRQSSNA